MKKHKTTIGKLLILLDDIEAEEQTIDIGYYCGLKDKIRKIINKLRRKNEKR